MSEYLKISGKKFTKAASSSSSHQASSAQISWKFTVRPGGWVIAESSSGERKRFALHEAKGKTSIAIDGRLHFGEWIQERKGHGASAAGGDADLTAQFPGKVRKVLIAAGAKVEAGTPLILVEAMKMEFTVKAPVAGIVNRVLVTEGQQLSPGDRFFDFAEAEVSNGE